VDPAEDRPTSGAPFSTDERPPTSRTGVRVLVLAGVVVVLAFAAFGPGIVQALTKESTSPQLATAAVESFPITVSASGTLQPASLVNVNFATAGVIGSIDVHVGQAVQAGQRLAQLNDAGQQADLQAAEATQAAAEQVLQALEASGGTAIEIANAKAQLASAAAQVVHAQQDEAATVLSAPAAGTVLQVNAQVGDSVSAGPTSPSTLPGTSSAIVDPNSNATAIIVIGNSTSFQVVAPFSQQAATQLATGQTGTVTFDALPGVRFACRVAAIASTATSVNGVPEFYAALLPSGTDPRLRTGMTANVSVTVAQATNVLAVPSQAVYFGSDATYVSVWRNGKSVPTQVTVGLVGAQRIQITSGLTAGEQVVLSSPQTQPTSGQGASGTASS
jgi:macrolide-specific efflux system membrane fusion protein